MTRTLTRTHLNSSRLIRILADLALLEEAGPMNAFAEKLGLWVDFADAIALSAAHTTGAAVAPRKSSLKRASAEVDLVGEFERVRITLVQAIVPGGASKGVKNRIAWPTPQRGATAEELAHYEPYRRYHLAHQRDMDLAVRALRARLRDAVSQISPSLKHLAALDAAFDAILNEREGRLLATLPSLMEKRFRQLLSASAATPGETSHGGCHPRFLGELQAVLLAELDVRLQPALGILEAFQSEKQQNLEPQV